MQFAFTEDQRAVVEAVRELLADSCTPADLRRQLAAGDALDAGRWTAIRDMGLIGLCAPESAGGLGLGMVELAAVAEIAGYVGLPEPLVELAGVAVPLLAGLADDRGWLARVLDGAVVALGHPADPFVAGADAADALLLDHGGELHLVERPAVSLVRQQSFDPFRRLFRVDWTPTAATRVGTGWGQAADRGALLGAAQLVGIAQRAIDMAVAHAGDRQQFGKPIGSYQAVKHLAADAQVKVEFARPVVHAAAAELPLGTLAARARVAHAAIAAGEAAHRATRNAVQIHGAMGMTWEVDLHFWVKRALALRHAWGTAADHFATIAERIDTLPTGADLTFASAMAVPG